VFLETVLCVEGEARNLPYHQQRLSNTLRHHGVVCIYDLKRLIAPPKKGVYRCRFIYDAYGFSVEYHPYSPKQIVSLRAVVDDKIEYPHKMVDRNRLDALYALRDGCDDVLIIREGQLTDTTIANIALFDGSRWLTPQKPLLEGTSRARLIDEGFLTPAPLRLEDIASAQKIAVFNALIGFVEVENGIIV